MKADQCYLFRHSKYNDDITGLPEKYRMWLNLNFRKVTDHSLVYLCPKYCLSDKYHNSFIPIREIKTIIKNFPYQTKDTWNYWELHQMFKQKSDQFYTKFLQRIEKQANTFQFISCNWHELDNKQTEHYNKNKFSHFTYLNNINDTAIKIIQHKKAEFTLGRQISFNILKINVIFHINRIKGKIIWLYHI